MTSSTYRSREGDVISHSAAPAASGMDGTRTVLAQAKTVVVKVGSSSLTTAAGGLDRQRLDNLVDAVARRTAAGSHVVLVSSGAIAAGLAPLGLPRRPRDLPTQQAAASVGQQQLAAHYAASFARHGLTVGQLLLTGDDVVRRSHYRNAQRTFARLIHFGVVPVVNENDTVATSEIRFGDNDRLAALVAHLVGADALVLLSDVDALYTSDPAVPHSQPIRHVAGADELATVGMTAAGSGLGTGGMASKITAALTATGAGVPVLLAAAADADRALETTSPEVGTSFAAASRRTSARLFWLRHAASPAGALALDAGAVTAITRRRKSLLPAGITGVRGDFEAGDVVDLIGPAGDVVARGFVGHDAAELPALIGQHLADLPVEQRREVVHADDLVRMSERSVDGVGTGKTLAETGPRREEGAGSE